MLSEISEAFQREVEELEPADADLSARLKGLIIRLARDAAEHVGESRHGEVAALLQLAGEALNAMADEAADHEDRSLRYGSRQAILNLLRMCHQIVLFDESRKKPADVAALRDLVADALSGIDHSAGSVLI
jgi:hypothetical protein